MSSPRSLKRARIPSKTARSRINLLRKTLAITFRVMSSEVGPRPPVTITTSARWTAVRNASAMNSASSPTVVWYEGRGPASARIPEIMSIFVFRTRPWRSSLPIVMISVVIPVLRSVVRLGCRPSSREDLEREVGVDPRQNIVDHNAECARKTLRPDHRDGFPDIEDAEEHEPEPERDRVGRMRVADRRHAADRDEHPRNLVHHDRA